jgi:hypothetical protein
MAETAGRNNSIMAVEVPKSFKKLSVTEITTSLFIFQKKL